MWHPVRKVAVERALLNGEEVPVFAMLTAPIGNSTLMMFVYTQWPPVAEPCDAPPNISAGSRNL